MLVILCALVNIVTTKEQLIEAITHSEKAINAAATQSRLKKIDAERFAVHVFQVAFAQVFPL